MKKQEPFRKGIERKKESEKGCVVFCFVKDDDDEDIVSTRIYAFILRTLITLTNGFTYKLSKIFFRIHKKNLIETKRCINDN